MHRPTRILLALLAFTFLSRPASAQTNPTDSLGGKTVHVYLPSLNIDTLVIQNLNITMKQDAQYWYSYTFTKAGLYDYQDGFYFTDPSHRTFFSKSGLGGTESPRFMLADFAGTKEIWIIVDPAGSSNAKPIIMLQAPKIVNILNPWSTTAPKLVAGTKTRNMTTVSGHCGWFSAMLLDTTMTKGHFAEISDAATYGKSGFSGTDDFDFASLFAQFGPTIWLNTDANSWTGIYPNVDGTCQYMMAMTVRDFSKSHPDFDQAGDAGNIVQKGMVEATLGPGAKPVRSSKAPSTAVPVTFDTFDSWWKTDTTNTVPTLRSYESCYDLPMSKSSDGLWEFDSYRDSPDHGFWPVEGPGLNRFNETMPSCYVKPPPDTTVWVSGPQRNGNFCAEAHATFVYKKGQKFAFRGDDDVWAFIDGKLAIDLGGKHTPKSDSVNLDDPKLALAEGKTYKWDFFYCDREHCGSSLRIKTSIFFLQQRSLYGDQEPGPTPGSVILKIWKRQGGTGSCASVGSDTTSTPAKNLTYQLLDATGKVVKELTNPGSFYGGITIAEPQVSIDTSKIVAGTDLVSGATYQVVAFEPANQKTSVKLSFKVPVRNLVEFEPPYTVAAVPVGTLVKVVAANREKTALIASAEKYTPTWPAGLEVYQDATRSVKLTSGTTLFTDSSGYDTLWVTGTATAKTDQTYTMSIPNSTKTVTLTFLVPKNRVEFDPPFATDTLVGSLVTLHTSNLENGKLVAGSQTYSLNIPAGLKVYSDAAKTISVTAATQLATDSSGHAVLYATADSTDLIDKTYILEIIGSAQKMTLTFRMPPLVLPHALGAFIYDDDADGIADRIVVQYDVNISNFAIKSVSYSWPSASAAVPVTGAEAAKGVLGKELTLKGVFSAAVLTSGAGTLTTVWPARKADSTQTTPISDKIGPIIKTAVISLGTTEDTLRITLSESVKVNAITATLQALWGIKRAPDGTVESVPPVSMIWNVDGTIATLIYTNTASNVPRAGNLVRINDGPGMISDMQGNTAGTGSRFRLITGGKRSEIKTVTYRIINPDQLILKEPALVTTLQPTNSVIGDVVESTKRMGHLIQSDLGAYATTDDFSHVDPATVTLEYQATYFTKMGGFVNGGKRVIPCTDTLFHGDCMTHRGFVFVGWNYTAENGAKVGTGAYIARLRYQIKVAGAVKESASLDQTWGILRQ